LLERHLAGAVPLEVLVRDAVDGVQLGLAAHEQDLRRVRLGVDRQGDRRVAEHAGSFRAFFAVHMTISEPFQTNPIGVARGVPSSPMKASRVRSRARSSWLSGWFRTSSIALWCMAGLLLRSMA
jgi:hypothetical protein